MLYQDDRPGKGPLTAVGVAATLAVHGAIVLVVVLGRAHASKNLDEHPIGQFVDVQAVKFGKPRDLSFLPHKEAPQVVKAPRPKLALTENAQALPRLKPDEKKPDVVEDDPLKHTHAAEFKNLRDDDTPPAGSVEGEGDPRGLRGGTATVGKGPVYYQHLQAAVQNAWVVPTTISDSELAGLKAQACIKIDESGKVTEFHMSKPSGNDRFDATLLDALGSIKELEPPTPDVKDAVTTDGVCMNFAKTR